MATKVIENTNTRLFGLIFFGKMASIYSANGPKTIAPVASGEKDGSWRVFVT